MNTYEIAILKASASFNISTKGDFRKISSFYVMPQHYYNTNSKVPK